MEVISEERVERYRRVLGLDPAAGVDDVRRCYRREMRRWHPDVVGGDAERAKLINEARDYFTGHPSRIAAARVKPNPQPRTPQPPRRTPPAPAAATRVAADPVAEPPRGRQPSYSTSPSVAPVPQSTATRQVAVVPELQDIFWRVVGGAIKVLYYLVIASVALFIFALVGYFLTVVLPWFLKVVVPIAWP